MTGPAESGTPFARKFPAGTGARVRRGGLTMALLRWALLFLVVAIIAAVFGFSNIAGGAAEIARVLFFIFVVVFVILLIAGAATYRAIAD